MRAGGGFSSFFPTQTVAFKLALALVVGSVVAALLKDSVGHLLLLSPALVRGSFFLWQLVTYAFIELNPMGLIFGAIILWSIGGSLEQTWGGKRMVIFLLSVAVLAGVLTVLASFFSAQVFAATMPGGNVLTTGVWLAYGWGFGKRQTNFWGMPVTGNMLAGIGIAFVVLNAVMVSWSAVLPELFAIPLIFLYVKFGGPDLILTRIRAWMLQRKLKSKTKHLRVVEKDRNIGGGSDQFLH